jgi:hypothetical protein
MKSFKEMLGETVDKIKSPDEQNFVDKHIVDKKDHPVAKDDQFIAKTKKKKRVADRDDDEAVYEERSIECEECGATYKKGEEHECDMEEQSVSESNLSEAVIDDLRKIVKTKQNKRIKLGEGTQPRIDMFTASALVQVHDALNGSNQKKFADAIGKNENMFMKMVDFAFSKAKK